VCVCVCVCGCVSYLQTLVDKTERLKQAEIDFQRKEEYMRKLTVERETVLQKQRAIDEVSVCVCVCVCVLVCVCVEMMM